MLSKNRNTGGYSLAGHPQGELTSKEVNMLYDMAKILSLGTTEAHLQIQRFNTVVPAAGTTDVTFTTTVDVVEVWGGWAKVEGADADFEFDIGYTGATNAFIDDFNSGSDGEVAIDADYLATGEDVILTITSNSSTTPITVEIVLLTVKPVTS